MIPFMLLSLFLSAASLAQEQDSLCVVDPAQMPNSWRPSIALRNSLNPAPWSESEAKDAEYAIKTGLDEMIDYFRQKPSVVQDLWGDSIEALIQLTYSNGNTPEFDAKVRSAARDNLTALVTPYLARDPNSAKCDEFESLLPLAIFAHRLYPAQDARTNAVTKRANAAYRDCGSLVAATEYDIQRLLADKLAHPEDLFEVHVWSLWFMEAEQFPDIDLPVEAREYGPALWKYFETYELDGASQFEAGARNQEFIAIADLATHITHMPTAVHRYPLYVEDSPRLYRFHRENFYPVMRSGELALIGSFVDTLRQYGCTPENDVQVRDGARYLLKVFHGNDDRWMNYRPAGERDAYHNDYDLIHYPWTGVIGLRARRLEQPASGTVGRIVRRRLHLTH